MRDAGESAPLDVMHRRIAGALTGRTTAWVVLVAWIIVFIVLGSFAGKLTGVQDNDAKSWLPGTAESTRALDLLDKVQDPNDLTTTVVYHRAGGLTPTDFATISAQARQMAGVDGVVSRPPAPGKAPEPLVSYPTSAAEGQHPTGGAAPSVSRDGQVATVSLVMNFGNAAFDKMPDARDALLNIAHLDGGQVYVSGQGGDTADQADAFAGIDGVLLLAAGIVVIVILLLTYRSPVLWILPIVSVVVALATATGLTYLLAKYAGLTVNGQSQAILYVLVFGAGTDYALLLIARYREELRNHEDRHEAMAFALHRAAPAIIASAATVTLSMLCLLIAQLNSTSSLGPVCAIGIVVCLVVMVTLLPALLVICGRWVFWPARPSYGTPEPTASGVWARLGRRIEVRPRKVWAITAAALVVCCAGLFTLDAQGLSGADQYTKTFASTTGDNLMIDHGLADPSSPVEIVANPGAEQAVLSALRAAGFTQAQVVTPPSAPVAVATVLVDQDPTSQPAFDTVNRIRSAVHAVPGADALVTGAAAVQLDVRTATDRDARVIIPLILLVVLVILMLLLRALVAPVVLILTVVLSFGAALGISSVLFKTVFGFAGEGPEFPLFVFVFLVALGIDYNIFLMTRVREETAAHGTRKGSLIALGATGGVITSAGIVLAATFAMLGTLPFVSFVEIGAAVALGVLLDTLIVRSVLVTSLNLDLGRRIWWPSRLDRQPLAAGDRVTLGSDRSGA